MLRRLRFFSTKSSSQCHEDFFRYTSGRWLHREQEQQSLRYRKFNVQALKDVAMRSVGAEGVASFQKLAEGRCNKVFHVEMTNGRRVVARIPTPLAGLPHIVTASEVATMRFLRDRLGLTQVPRVLAWSSKAEETDVGAEYIIMDVVDGVELHSVWHELSMKQKLRLVHQWVKLESKIVKSFRNGGGYGSLYFRKDIPAEDRRDVVLEDGTQDEEFVLGPSTLQTGCWEDLYGSSVELDRGPCLFFLSSLRATLANVCRIFRARRTILSQINNQLRTLLDSQSRKSSDPRVCHSLGTATPTSDSPRPPSAP